MVVSLIAKIVPFKIFVENIFRCKTWKLLKLAPNPGVSTDVVAATICSRKVCTMRSMSPWGCAYSCVTFHPFLYLFLPLFLPSSLPLPPLPQGLVEKGLKADEWVKVLSPLLGGKAGGKDTSAQGSGTNTDRLQEAVEAANQFAFSKLTSS